MRGDCMVQQDNKPNNVTLVDGRPVKKEFLPRRPADVENETKEYVTDHLRDDDPLLSANEKESSQSHWLEVAHNEGSFSKPKSH